MKWSALYDWRTRKRLGATAQVVWPEENDQYYSETQISKRELLTFQGEAEELLRFTVGKVLDHAFQTALKENPPGNEVTYLVTLSRRDELGPVEGVVMRASVVEVLEEP